MLNLESGEHHTSMQSLQILLYIFFMFVCLCSLQASSRVMELDHMDGKLKIHYSDRLVSLLKEVRQLSALGFNIPAKIQQAAHTAEKFYRQAIVLKQVHEH